MIFMKKAIALVLALAAVVMLLCAGCGAQAQVATLTLTSNPTTGYSWMASQSEELFTITSEYTPDSTDPAITGAGGTQVFTLTPVKAGTTTVTFVYARSWEDAGDADSCAFFVTVGKDMTIEVTGCAADLSGDADTVPEIPHLVIKDAA